MAKIKKLPSHEAQKIAAGEVVERPANVVKELIENAIDAGATTIDIYIEDGGKQLIRVVDNGYGMERQDAHLCFSHHATSKIASITDLNSIKTFGFRGEALSSIASISKIILRTKEQESQHGIELQLDAAIVKNETEIAVNHGTDIEIQDLFFNVPARKKFLKKRETEWRHIINLFHAFCLSYRTIHFKLHSEEKLIHTCPPVTKIIDRLAQLEDYTFTKNMIEIKKEHAEKKILVVGAISNHQYFRYDRSSIYFFVNHRWVKNFHLSRALIKGYANVMQQGRYPAACIFVTVDPAHLDINTHPRKEEVSFLHPRSIELVIQQAVKEALEKHLSQQISKPVNFAPAQSIGPTFSNTSNPFTHLKKPTVAVNHIQTFATPQEFSVEQTEKEIQKPLSLEQELTQSIQTDQATFQIIGQYNKTYILLEKQDGLFIIDQHAAHERILYEQFSKRFDELETIKLIFPPIITFSRYDIQLIEPHLPLFIKNGIEIERFGSDQLIIQSTPVHIKHISFADLLKQVIGWIKEYKALDENEFEKTMHKKLQAQMACKAAIKAGDTLTQEQMSQLLKDLYKTQNRFSCPHGRPTGWLLNLYEIEKRFKRKL